MEKTHDRVTAEEKLQRTNLIREIVAEFIHYQGEKDETYFTEIRERIRNVVNLYLEALQTMDDSKKNETIKLYLKDIGYLSSTSIFTPSDVNQFMGQLNSKRIE